MEGLLGELTPQFDVEGYFLEPKYRLAVGESEVILNDWLGHGITLTYLQQLPCRNCAKEARKLYGGGYCYDCFSTLARCDLCVMSPDRCHFHLGTCREPDWGENFCMQPHSVYLAVTSGAKIGITRAGRERRRWLDQGANRALRIIAAPTRRAAGVVETYFKRRLNDRTDWRKLVRGMTTATDLSELAGQLRRQLESFTDLQADILSSAEVRELDWVRDSPITEIKYPVHRYSPAKRLALTGDQPQICDNLQGIVGRFLLFSQGVVNLADYRGSKIEIKLGPAFSSAELNKSDQLSLFD